MLRTFRLQTCTGNAQPLFGDVLTAAFSNVQNNDNYFSVKVADTTLYKVGDRIVLGVGQAGQNIVLVSQIFSSTVLYVQSEGNAPLSYWGNNTIIALSMACADIILTANPTNVDTLWIGSDNTVTSAGAGNVIGALTPSFPPFRFTGNGQWNAIRTTDGWLAGLAGQQFIATFEQI
jgi:hypothetical protein